MAFVDRIAGLPFVPTKTTAEQKVGKHRVSYRVNEHSDTAVASFLQRTEVESAFSYFSRRRKVHLRTVDIQARDGTNHTYLMLQQGRKRSFVFDREQNPALFHDLDEDPLGREKQIQKRLSFTSAVPQKIMHDAGILPTDGQVFRKFESRKDVQHTLKTIEEQTYWMVRGNPKDQTSLENNTDFIQPIPSVVVVDPQPKAQNILLSVRGEESADDRLKEMLMPLFSSGHSDPGDFLRRFKMFLRYGLKYAMYRETAEETAFRKKGNGEKPFHVFPQQGEHDFGVNMPGIWKLNWYYRLTPLGVIHMQDQPVDKVHAGLIYKATPRRKNRNVEFTLNGSSKETTEVLSLSPAGYRDAITVWLPAPEPHNPNKRRIFKPASWTTPIVEAIEAESNHKPSLLRQKLRRALGLAKAA